MLDEALQIAREAGYVISIGQHIPLAAGVAAPLQIAPGLVGSVSATRLRHDTTDTDLERLGPVVRKAADAIEDVARYRAPTESPAHPSSADATALGRIQRLLEILVAEPSGAPTGVELARRLAANEATAAKLRTTALTSGLAVADDRTPHRRRPAPPALGRRPRTRLEHRRTRARRGAGARPDQWRDRRPHRLRPRNRDRHLRRRGPRNRPRRVQPQVGTPDSPVRRRRGQSHPRHCPRRGRAEPVPAAPHSKLTHQHGAAGADRSRSARPGGHRPKANASLTHSGSPRPSSPTKPLPDPSPSRSPGSAPRIDVRADDDAD